jgi:hypothetical protein
MWDVHNIKITCIFYIKKKKKLNRRIESFWKIYLSNGNALTNAGEDH